MTLLAERIANKLMEDENADEWEVATYLAPRATTESIELLLKQANRIVASKKAKVFDVVEWMAEHGHTSYKRHIATLKAAADIWMNEDAESVPEVIEAKIEEIKQMAQDRYNDWATD
jgi:hypothetical protein